MAVVAISDSILTDIADAIRSKNGTENTYKPSQMPDAIEAISGGGITPTGTIEITQNGVVDVTNYASADVDVPNSYSSTDEGKVVSNGDLVSQTSMNIAINGSYDTTVKNEVIVNVPQGITPTGTKQISITQNGTTTEDVTNYANAEITVDVQGGGGSEETGSFVAGASQSNVTLNVSALHSHVAIWDSTVKSDDDLTGAPYGTKKTILIYADNNTGFVIYGAIDSNGTGFAGQFSKIGRWGGNTAWNDRVEFTASNIKVINPRISGSAWPLIDGHTYNWRAW